MPTRAEPDLDLPDLLRHAAHPLRWRLLTELGRSDRRVHELTGLVDAPQNLVSYHLGKLRAAGLVSARRSSADRRDSYYAVDLPRVRASLAATGAAVHPGVRLVPEPLDAADRPRRRVLFLCTGNSARSQMAEALTEARSGGAVEARSAGSHPRPLHPDAVRAMREEHGIDIADRRSKHLDEVIDEPFDRVITLCDRVREVCPDLPGTECVHWSTPDPAAASDGAAALDGFRRTAAELAVRIEFLVAELVTDTRPIPA